MISNTQKLILAAGLAVNIAGIATLGVVMHNRDVASHTIQLGAVIVTPVDAGVKLASNGTVELAPVVVTRAHSEERYAARDVEREAAVAPGMGAMVQAIDALSPGQYLDSSAALNVLSTLAFERVGR
ncbi:MAG TPA: hypothetical protein VF117_04490 [Gammaproteobacteria bacterium]